MFVPMFWRSWLRVVRPEPLEYPETNPELPVAVHENVVPATFEVSVIPVQVLLHIIVLGGAFDRFATG